MGRTIGVVTTEQLEEFVDLTDKDFKYFNKTVDKVASQLYIVQDMPKNTGNSKRIDEVDSSAVAHRKREGVNSHKASMGVGYTKTITKERFAEEFDFTKEMFDENKDPSIIGQLRNLNECMADRLDFELTMRFTYATATSFTNMDGDTVTTTMGDGLAFAYSAHTCKFDSATYRNRVAGDPIFSKGGFQAARLLANTNIVDNFGARKAMDFNVIVTGDDPSTVDEVQQFLNSVSDNSQNNSGVTNTQKGKWRHIILPYLAYTALKAYDSTKRRHWFIAAIGQGVNGLQAYNLIWERPFLKKPGHDDYSADVLTLGARASWGMEIVSGRGAIFSCPVS